jgi:hypothetical protein
MVCYGILTDVNVRTTRFFVLLHLNQGKFTIVSEIQIDVVLTFGDSKKRVNCQHITNIMGNVLAYEDDNDESPTKVAGRRRANTAMPAWGAKQLAALNFNRANSGSMYPEGDGPGPVKDHCAVIVPLGESMFIFGGMTNEETSLPIQVHELTSSTGQTCLWKLRRESDKSIPYAPNELIYHTALHHQPSNSVIILGDLASTTFDNKHIVLRYDIEKNTTEFITFHNQAKLRPFKLGCTPIHRRVNDTIVLFNDTNEGIELNDIIELDMRNLKWSYLRFSVYFSVLDQSPQSVKGTWFHSNVYSPRLDSMIVFGGLNMTEFRTLDSVWRFNLGNKCCTRIVFEDQKNGPCARYLHSACIVNEFMYVFGGCHMKTNQDKSITRETLNDLYQLDLVGMLWKKIDIFGQVPCSRINHSMQPFIHKNFVCLIVHAGQDQRAMLLDDTYRIMIPRLKASSMQGWMIHDVLRIHQKLRHCTDCVIKMKS